MTITGSGYANRAIRSAAGCPARPSTRSAVIDSIRGLSRSTIRGVNALLTRLRSRVWSGGSTTSIDRPGRPRPGGGGT